MATENIVAQAEKLAKALGKVKIKGKAVGFTLKVFSHGEVCVECGWNYPEVLCDKLDDACAKSGFDGKVSIVADSGGGIVLKEILVNGGKNRNPRWF